MLRSRSSIALVILALSAMVAGIGYLLRYRDVTSVTDDFMSAVIAGDRRAILSLLHPDLLEHTQSRLERRSWLFARPQRGLSYRIHHITYLGGEARVKLWIERDGFVVKPTLRLARSETADWRVRAIEGLEPDPLWHDLQQKRAQHEGEALAAELAAALGGIPGVEVRRLTTESPQNPPQ